jgi:redox-sensitive bicupin YhaK (pirin superfamily)
LVLDIGSAVYTLRGRLVASTDGRDGSVAIHQDAGMYSSLLSPGQAVLHELAADRYGWLQVVSGELSLNGLALSAGDGAAVFPEASRLSIEATSDSHLLLFDLA